ncbi:UDP-glucuronosyltransferase 2A1-like isoform X3 [Spea bombifrons]|uniref:UDP-glucuronosyltransferase 2A1-like isoform X3 n=1 Tax=Spea bombifrons TaxID=233779 RepID=UPI0023492FFE|nr:UDP-glucuronosyltransferase 2A1-like isoform X3 [Spea bombifrons]
MLFFQCIYKSFLLYFLLAGRCLCGNVIVWPAEHSHLMSLKLIIGELIARGHKVTMLVHSASINQAAKESSSLHIEVVKVNFTSQELQSVWERFLQFWVYERHQIYFWKIYSTLRALSRNVTFIHKQICGAIVGSKKMLAKLRRSNFDVLLSDPVLPCGELLAQKLNIPFVYSLRFSAGFVFERLCGKAPAPSSFVPAATSELQEQMGFLERVQNFVLYLVHDLFQVLVWKEWDFYYSYILGYPTSLCEVMGKADIWLIRTYWDFEYPRPTLPNFDFVGGLHCTPAKPLPEEMEEVVQGSGDHGIVVFSLGSMVKNLSEERSNMIAAALSQLPQKVIWRYSGKKPDTLGENTIVYDWIPQNDLLGHPKTKAFITHGGTNGIYEAIYHGIPMVGIPLFADQPDNMVHMKTKGMAVMLDFNKMKTQDLVDAVNTVINDPSYKENALRISSIHHDQPIKPLDRAVFWIEFVMRHKGAKHLRPASHDLTWYQYHCLDVIGFLLVCLLTVLYISVKLFTFCCRKCCRTKKKLKTQ